MPAVIFICGNLFLLSQKLEPEKILCHTVEYKSLLRENERAASLWFLEFFIVRCLHIREAGNFLKTVTNCLLGRTGRLGYNSLSLSSEFWAYRNWKIPVQKLLDENASIAVVKRSFVVSSVTVLTKKRKKDAFKSQELIFREERELRSKRPVAIFTIANSPLQNPNQ